MVISGNMNKMNEKEVIYMIRLNDNQIDRDELGYLFRETRCGKLFCGVLVNISCSHLYFEHGKNKELVIIPHRWVEWMAPVKKAFKEGE